MNHWFTFFSSYRHAFLLFCYVQLCCCCWLTGQMYFFKNERKKTFLLTYLVAGLPLSKETCRDFRIPKIWQILIATFFQTILSIKKPEIVKCVCIVQREINGSQNLMQYLGLRYLLLCTLYTQVCQSRRCHTAKPP